MVDARRTVVSICASPRLREEVDDVEAFSRSGACRGPENALGRMSVILAPEQPGRVLDSVI